MSKKSHLDLLVRVRYLNPIPPPPFPPKLFDTPTDVTRLGEPSYLDNLASGVPLPMLVDSEMGMPLDLNQYEKVWTGDDEALNPEEDPTRVHHPTDALLLAPTKAAIESNGLDKPLTASEVSWMRNSNLFTRKAGAKRKEGGSLSRPDEVVDSSIAAQIMAIDKTFSDLDDTPLDEMKHPNPRKRDLKVVESYDILPDPEAWSNTYFIMKFPERPSGSTATNPNARASSPKLSRAVLRPIKEDDQQFMEYYLPEDEGVEQLEKAYDDPVDAERLQKLRDLGEEEGGDTKIDEVFTNARYDRIRTYEVVTQEVPSKEVLLVIDEGGHTSKRRKGAYIKEINMRTALRKTRLQNVDRSDLWDKARIGFREPGEDEVDARDKAREQVVDPTWVNEQLREIRGTNEAEGLGEAIDDE